MSVLRAVDLSRRPVAALRHRCRVLRPVETPDGAGGVSVRFVAGPAIWAAVEAVALARGDDPSRAFDPVTHRLHARRHPDLAPGRRLDADGVPFLIRAVAIVGRGERVVADLEPLPEGAVP